jgi:hypothetical protein
MESSLRSRYRPEAGVVNRHGSASAGIALQNVAPIHGRRGSSWPGGATSFASDTGARPDIRSDADTNRGLRVRSKRSVAIAWGQAACPSTFFNAWT